MAKSASKQASPKYSPEQRSKLAIIDRAYADVTHLIACGELSASAGVELFSALRKARERIELHKGTEIPEIAELPTDALNAMLQELRLVNDSVSRSVRMQIVDELRKRGER